MYRMFHRKSGPVSRRRILDRVCLLSSVSRQRIRRLSTAWKIVECPLTKQTKVQGELALSTADRTQGLMVRLSIVAVHSHRHLGDFRIQEAAGGDEIVVIDTLIGTTTGSLVVPRVHLIPIVTTLIVPPRTRMLHNLTPPFSVQRNLPRHLPPTIEMAMALMERVGRREAILTRLLLLPVLPGGTIWIRLQQPVLGWNRLKVKKHCDRIQT